MRYAPNVFASRRKSAEIPHFSHCRAELGVLRQKLRKIATRSRQSTQRHRRAVEAKLVLDKLQHRANPLPSRRLRRFRSAGPERSGLLENPRVAQAAAADGHGIGAGFLQHPNRIGRRADAAAAEDGNPHRLLHPGNDAPIGFTDVSLRDASGMNAHGGRARRLGHGGTLQRPFRAGRRARCGF